MISSPWLPARRDAEDSDVLDWSEFEDICSLILTTATTKIALKHGGSSKVFQERLNGSMPVKLRPEQSPREEQEARCYHQTENLFEMSTLAADDGSLQVQ